MKTLFSIFLASGILLLVGCTPKSPEAEIGKVYQGSPEEFNANNETNSRVERKFDEDSNILESKGFIDMHSMGINQNYILKYKYEFF